MAEHSSHEDLFTHTCPSAMNIYSCLCSSEQVHPEIQSHFKRAVNATYFVSEVQQREATKLHFMQSSPLLEQHLF